MKTSRATWVIYLLLALASVHCVRSVYLVNVSLLDLDRYERGMERMPFQGRVGMIPVLRWAHSDHAVAKAAAFFDSSLKKTPHMLHPPENYSPEKLVVMVLGVVSMGSMIVVAVWWGRRYLGKFWWLPAVFVLAMFYVMFAARYEMEFWYPYDLVHCAICGIACLCLMERKMVAALALFVVDVPLRETSIYLVAIVLALGYARGQRRQAILLSTAMVVAVWFPVHVWIHFHYVNNPSDTGVSRLAVERAILNPLHWPQIASAFGFLAVPLIMGRRFLTREQSYFLLGMAPCLVVTCLFGIWYETRIFGEWILPAAALLATEFVGWVRASGAEVPVYLG